VPIFLRVVVRRFRRYANQREILYIRAAMETVRYYIGHHIVSRNQDSYLRIQAIPGTAIADPSYQLRILLIAETLFLLRHSDGFAEFCRRLGYRDIRAAFYEAFSARLFLEAQYEIHARPETYVKGEDYDFSATKNGERINVEVTTLAAKQFSPKTIPNSLGQKHKQVPNTAPAIVFVGLPPQWVIESRDWESYLTKVTRDFFRQTKKINAVVFMGENFFIGGVAIIKKPYPNHEARNKMENMDFLFSDREESRNSEFFRWIDYIVPPEGDR
jgi:hypothetical protein